mgnify:CR=1 FL=1
MTIYGTSPGEIQIIMQTEETEHIIFGLGSNQGDRKSNIDKAIEILGNVEGIEINLISSLYKTSPLGNPNQPDFFNRACTAGTTVSPHKLLSICLEIESQLGRDPDHPRWSPRPIDLDILFYGKHVIQSSDLIIPHPRFSERLFALIPSVEIAPEFLLPNGMRLKEYFDKRSEDYDFSEQKVEKIAE